MDGRLIKNMGGVNRGWVAILKGWVTKLGHGCLSRIWFAKINGMGGLAGRFVGKVL